MSISFVQREELFPEYPPGAFASVAKFGRRHWGNVLDTGVLELFDRRLTFTTHRGLMFDATVDEITKIHVGWDKAAFDFDQGGHRWTTAFVDRGAKGELRGAPSPPSDVTGPRGLPLFHLDDDMDSMRDLCSRWLAELAAEPPA